MLLNGLDQCMKRLSPLNDLVSSPNEAAAYMVKQPDTTSGQV